MKRILLIITALLAGVSLSFAEDNPDSTNVTVRTDRVWKYYAGIGMQLADSIITIRFDRFEEVDGRQYYVYKGFGEDAFLREEKHKVYRYVFSEIDSSHGPGEYLLFDFNLKYGDSFTGIQYKNDGGRLMPFIQEGIVVQSASTIGLESPSGKVYLPYVKLSLSRFGLGNYIAEGVGPVISDSGTFTTPIFDDEQGIHLDRLENLQGDVMCYGRVLQGISGIETDKSLSGIGLYDLNGREIRNPEPGTVYIQGGRKHVAPRR